jgi:tetratricopeptide (TPR) repeat protein
VEGAIADAEHLEAAAAGTRPRHEVCRRAAEALLDAGFVRDAGRLFERALRYLPDDAEATTGLGRALLEVGKVDRAAALFERALELSVSTGAVHGRALLDLGRLLAERFGDLPQAIARVRAVPSSSPYALEARFRESRWRARLGDLARASVAFGRAREELTLARPIDVRQAVEWITEAALFERDVMKDPVAAEKHLALAVKLAPTDRAAGALYRTVATEAALALRERRERG